MTSPDWPQTARAKLVAELRDAGDLISAAVRTAMEAVPRHKFLPGVAIAEAYANQPVIIKRDAEGNGLSSASQPSIVAIMLEQLDIQPGHRYWRLAQAPATTPPCSGRWSGHTARSPPSKSTLI